MKIRVIMMALIVLSLFAPLACSRGAESSEAADPATPGATTQGSTTQNATTRPAPFEKEIRAFEKSDRQTPPPMDANLFIGSSSIARWKTLAADFPGIPVINRGFGGSRIGDSTRFVDRIIVPYHPRRIFFYAGDNDLSAGRTPEEVAADFQAFVSAVRVSLPQTPIYFISIKPSPARVKLLSKAKQANSLIQAFIRQGNNLNYVDIFTPMLDADGQPRAELFGPDHLHMVAAGYAIWIDKIMPLLK